MIMQTGGSNNQDNEEKEYTEYENGSTTEVKEQYYDDTSYSDDGSNKSKRFIIIGAVVVAVILLLLLLLVFGGKKKKTVDNNSSLKNIVVEGAELEPAFNKDVLEYELKNATDTIRITCQADSENAAVEGCDMGEIESSTLTDDIVITVKAANGEEKVYTIKVEKGYEGIQVNVSGNESEWSSKPVTLVVDATSDSELAEEAYSFDGGNTWQKENTKTFSETTTVIIKVKDIEGRVSFPTTVEIKIDKDAKVLIKSIDGLPDGWTDNDVTLTVNAESSNNLAEEAYSFDGGKTWQKESSKTFTKNQDVDVVVRDERGNLSPSSKVTLKIDKSTPTVKINGTVASGKSTTGSVTLSANASTSPSGYKYQWYNNNSEIRGATGQKFVATNSGNYTVKVTNGLGKSSTSSSYSVSIVSGSSSNSGSSGGSGKSSSGSGNSSSSNGTVTISNVTGNPTSYTKSNVTLKVNASATNGLNAKAYSFDNGNTWQSSNTKTFSSNQTVYIKVRDKNGKFANQTININKIDKIGPNISFSSDGSNFAKSVNVKISVSDSGISSLGILNFALSTSNSKEPTFTSQFKSGDTIKVSSVNNSSGNYYLWIKATDKLGNVSIKCSKVFKIDNEAPSVPKVELYKWKDNKEESKPTSSKLNGASKYTANTWSNKYIFSYAQGSTDAKSGFDHYEYVLSGESGKSYNGAVQKGSYWHFRADGDSTVKYRACDKAGNCSAYTSAYKVRIDTKAPTVKFDPASAKTYASGKVVSATCTDSASGLTYMKTWDAQYSSDYRLYNSTATTKATTHKITLESTGSGRTIKVTCKDAAGNSVENKESPKFTITSSSTSNSGGNSGNNVSAPAISFGYSSTTSCDTSTIRGICYSEDLIKEFSCWVTSKTSLTKTLNGTPEKQKTISLDIPPMSQSSISCKCESKNGKKATATSEVRSSRTGQWVAVGTDQPRVDRGTTCASLNETSGKTKKTCEETGYWEGNKTVCRCTKYEYMCK